MDIHPAIKRFMLSFRLINDCSVDIRPSKRWGYALRFSSLNGIQLPNCREIIDLVSEIHLGDNELEAIPYFVRQFKHLRVLSLNNNQFIDPDMTIVPKSLIELDLGDNQLISFPDIFQHILLQVVNLSFNYITDQVLNLNNQNIQVLNLSNNRITTIPTGMTVLKNLKHLLLSYNGITEVPYEFEKIDKLETLDLDFNTLNEIPYCVREMKHLRTLSLSGNRITEVPYWLFDLPKLEMVNLRWNFIEEMPPEYHKMHNISINLRDNPLQF